MTTNTRAPAQELKPCPFCGCELDAQWDRTNPKARCRTDGCKGKQLPVLNLDVPEDIAAWNQRAPLSKLRAPVADERAAIQHHVDLVKAYGDQLYCKASASNPTDKNSWSKSAEAVLSNVAESYRAALASAPVAGEAPTDDEIIGMAVEPLGVDCDRMPYGVVIFARALLARYAAPQASEADDLIDALGKCRDAFPIPDKVGSKLDLLWQEAMSDPTAVPEYVKLCAALSAQPGAQKGGSDA